MLKCYCDGAFSSLKCQMGIGLAWYRDDRLVKEYSAGFSGGTSNIAELLAIYYAIRSFKGDKLTIYSDSQYALGCITKNWHPKKNIKLIKTIRDLLDDRFSFRHVKGHDTCVGNIRADELAVEGSHLIL